MIFTSSIQYQSIQKVPLRTVFGIVGRLSESKGLEHPTRILGIMADFPKEFLSDVVINHFGDVAIESESNRKDFENAIAAFTKRGGRFIFRGFQSRELIYSEVETIVHFAMDEPFGLIFLEALASRRNFVGFKGGGIAEIASKIGAENLLVELGDYKAFGEAMLFSRMSGAEMDVYRTNCAKLFKDTILSFSPGPSFIMISISVFVCTYNPRADLLLEVLVNVGESTKVVVKRHS